MLQKRVKGKLKALTYLWIGDIVFTIYFVAFYYLCVSVSHAPKGGQNTALDLQEQSYR